MSIQKERRNKGLCVNCGAPALENLRHSKAVAERKAKETGLPVARFLLEARCGPCWKKHSDAFRAAYSRKRDKARAASVYNHARYEDRIEAGLCVRCGRVSPTKGQTVCGACIQARGDRDKERVSERIAEAVCTGCGGPRELEKYKTCFDCRKRVTDRQREKRKRDSGGVTV